MAPAPRDAVLIQLGDKLLAALKAKVPDSERSQFIRDAIAEKLGRPKLAKGVAKRGRPKKQPEDT